jgi:hypothetical protein
MLFGTSNSDREPIINNMVALAEPTQIFDAQVVLSTVESRGISCYVTRA